MPSTTPSGERGLLRKALPRRPQHSRPGLTSLLPTAGSPSLTMWTSSLSSTSATRVASTERTSKTTECTAACTSSPPSGMGAWLSWGQTRECTPLQYGPWLCLCPRLAALGRLRPVDVGFMKALHEKVNIVPLIAKADCLVPSEIRKLKERVSLPPHRGLARALGLRVQGGLDRPQI